VAGGYTAQTVMGSAGGNLVWLEADMRKPASQTQQQLARINDRAELMKRVSEDPQPLMVAVTEAGAPGQPGQPRLLVIGSSWIATNAAQGGEAGVLEFDLMRGSIDWCRERYTTIGVQPKTYTSYMLPMNLSVARLIMLPTTLMLLTIFGMGMVVWNMRRR
jgi:hypothetical protein